jgi:NAD(P)-dependent dehydrogenase (short-subunit alcohol dehydrogenase family)
MSSFNGSIAIVTGAGSGIGESIARHLADSGAIVVICDVDGGRATNVAREIEEGGGQAFDLECDVSNEESVIAAVKRVSESIGTGNVLVNAAGIGAETSLIETSLSEFTTTLGVNLVGTFLMCREAARAMIMSGVAGKILNISSVQAGLGMPLASSYAASKGGIDGLTRAVAIELAPYGIRANVLRPGPTWTNMTSSTWSDENVARQVTARVPLSRIANPIEIANAALFLLSDESSYCTGITLDVDGGYSADGRVDFTPMKGGSYE